MKFQIAANWKMNKNPKEAGEFLDSFKNQWDRWKQEGKIQSSKGEIIFFPPAVNWSVVSECLQGTPFSWGPQNTYYKDQGAFTGENSPQVATLLGATYALVGHSERRNLFLEQDEDIPLKIKSLQSHKITPIVCVGESLSQKEEGETFKFLQNQMEKSLNQVYPPFQMAYEPLWAIGTGQVASPPCIRKVHQWIGEFLQNKYPENFSSIGILYGGSVKPENLESIRKIPEVNGILVGGASLQVNSFIKIVEEVVC